MCAIAGASQEEDSHCYVFPRRVYREKNGALVMRESGIMCPFRQAWGHRVSRRSGVGKKVESVV